MNWHTILGITATTVFFLPAAVILYNYLHRHHCLAALLASYLLTGFFNLMELQVITTPPTLVHYFGLACNYLDGPLLLFALQFFCPTRAQQKPLRYLLVGFVAYEAIITLLVGFRTQAVVFIIGPGILLVLVYAFYLFARQMKITVAYRKNSGRAVMLIAILFAYSCYAFLYIMYYVLKTPYASDVFLIYYIANLISATVMATGLHLIRRRLHELREVKNMRRELTVFFNS